MPANILARSARAASGLTQSQVASRSGIAGSSLSLIEHGKREPTVATLDTLLRAVRHSVILIPTVRSDAANIAASIAKAVTATDDASAFRYFIQLADNLAAESGTTRIGLTMTEPATTGSKQWNAAIAALCEFRLNQDRLTVPPWIIRRRKPLDSQWEPHTSDYAIPVNIKKVPKEFLRRGVLIEAQTLESI